MSAEVTVTALHKVFPDGTAALNAVSLRLPKGRLTTLLGPSGCGKSTLLRLLAGLETPSAGHIAIDGQDVTALGPAHRPISLVFQNYALFPYLNVEDNVRFGLRCETWPESTQRERVDWALTLLGLGDKAVCLPSELSGGQQQRVALARALALQPKVLLLDEPLSNLDAGLRRHIRDEIRGLQQRLGLTVVYVTHDHDEAMAVSDHIVLMSNGQVQQVGTPREMYAEPASERVAALMGDSSVLDAVADTEGCLQMGPLRVWPESQSRARWPAGPVRVVVRPQGWRMEPADGQGLAGKVLSRAYMGRQTEYQVRTELGTLLVVGLSGRHGWAPGAPVSLRLDAQHVSVMPRGCAAMPAGP